MAFQLSPGINVSEIDLSTVVPSVATSIGGVAGNFNWGGRCQRYRIRIRNVLESQTLQIMNTGSQLQTS